MKFIGIMAMSKNGVIGKDGRLPWNRIPEDMAFFRMITKGTIVVMGSKTFRGCGVLPGRINLVLTSNPSQFDEVPDVIALSGLGEMLSFVKQQTLTDCKEVYVIGGTRLYEQMIPLLDAFLVTRVESDFDGDTFAPRVCTSYCEDHPPFNIIQTSDVYHNPLKLSFFRIPREYMQLG